jgi:hypothetical protein
MKPNLFKIATSELSQDGFITWLAQWADPSCKPLDAALHQSAQGFIRDLVKNPELSIEKVSTRRQWNHIDVAIEVNDKILIIIEDKTSTGQHSNQLNRYRQFAAEYCKQKQLELFCIYLKIGDEPKVYHEEMRDGGWRFYGLADFLNTLNATNGVHNAIYLDFREHLSAIATEKQNFRQKPLGEWNSVCWTSFFQYLEQEGCIEYDWWYVNNPNGGFWGTVLCSGRWLFGQEHVVYIQIEESKLTFRIRLNTEASEDHKTIRDKWYSILVSRAQQSGMKEITRPDRFSTGKTMTVAVINGEHWLGAPNEVVNLERAVANLRKYRDWFYQELLSGL